MTKDEILKRAAELLRNTHTEMTHYGESGTGFCDYCALEDNHDTGFWPCEAIEIADKLEQMAFIYNRDEKNKHD